MAVVVVVVVVVVVFRSVIRFDFSGAETHSLLED